MKRRSSGLWFLDDSSLPYFIGLASKNCNTANYNEKKEKIRRNEKHILKFETGIFPDKIFFLDQKHGDTIVEASEPYFQENMYYAEGDALITDISGYCLVIRTADCVPVFIYDKKSKAAAAIHSGWKSTHLNITASVIKKMKERYSSEPKNLVAYILPCIGSDYYEVKDDVSKLFEGFIDVKDGKCFLDLKGVVVSQLREEGVERNSIFADFRDTFSFNSDLFSHRKGDLGRNLNFIYIK